MDHFLKWKNWLMHSLLKKQKYLQQYLTIKTIFSFFFLFYIKQKNYIKSYKFILTENLI